MNDGERKADKNDGERKWEGGIHSFESFGRAIVAEAVRRANEQVAEQGLTGDSMDLDFQVRVKFQGGQAERASEVCCVCTFHGGFTLCKGWCC